MADLSEFPFHLRLFFRAYRWQRVDPVPWAPLEKPLAECRLALVSTAGLVPPGQDPFDESVRGGDPSFREIPSDAAVADLRDTHRSEFFDHAGMRRDPNLAFPLDRVRELEARRRIGSVARRHVSVMGSLTAVGRFRRDTLPEVARRLVADGVDVALLVPV
ncbi:MAG: glycine/sarcosine/betaine reductase selenoprotein B family protein [Thermoanaerobaculia bacterium]